MTTPLHHLPARAPFDFTRSLAFLGAFRPLAGEQRIATRELELTRALRQRGRTLAFTVRAAPGGVSCALHAPRPLLSGDVEAALDRVRFWLSLDDDLAPFEERARGDRAFAPVLRSLHGMHQVKLPTPFENACWAVLGQRCPMPLARRMKDRLIAAYGGVIEVAGARLPAFPEATELAGRSHEALTAAIGHPLKARRVLAVAEAFAGVDERFLRHGPHAEVREWLLAVEGIGAWSAAFVMLRGLGRMEAIGGAELELLPAFEAWYGARGVAGLRAVAERYGDQRGTWALYLRAAEAVGAGVRVCAS